MLVAAEFGISPIRPWLQRSVLQYQWQKSCGYSLSPSLSILLLPDRRCTCPERSYESTL